MHTLLIKKKYARFNTKLWYEKRLSTSNMRTAVYPP